MISVQEAAEEFSSLAAARGHSAPIQSAARELHPYVCLCLLNKIPVQEAYLSDPGYLASGIHNARIEECAGLKFLTDGIDPIVFSKLPLDGHVPFTGGGIYRWLHLAVADLQRTNQAAASYLSDWSRAIVWLRKVKYAPEPELTSVAIPSSPFYTFITKKAIRHIPPTTIIPAVTLYALQENIYHEALHQQLSVGLLFRDLVDGQSSDWPEVDIPWRATSWPLDRAIHAAWVYAGLLGFRRTALACDMEGGPLVTRCISESLLAAEECFNILVHGISVHSERLTHFGKAIVTDLLRRQTM